MGRIHRDHVLEETLTDKGSIRSVSIGSVRFGAKVSPSRNRVAAIPNGQQGG